MLCLHDVVNGISFHIHVSTHTQIVVPDLVSDLSITNSYYFADTCITFWHEIICVRQN